VASRSLPAMSVSLVYVLCINLTQEHISAIRSC